MKYLKLFEDLGYEYYEEISWPEYMKSVGHDNGSIQLDYIRDKYERFTKGEIDQISQILDENGDFKLVVNRRGDIGIGDNSEFSARFEITKISDEWFYLGDVSDEGKAYKCDQFDGLIKCLEDII